MRKKDTTTGSPAAQPHATLTPGQLATTVKVSVDTLRFYESKGLLARPLRTAGGHRVYTQVALKRVQMIRAALSIGFTVEELKAIFHTRDSGGAPCQQVFDIASGKIAQLDQAIQQLTLARGLLSSTLRRWRRQFSKVPRGERAGLLEMFAHAHPETAGQLSPLLSFGLRRHLRK